MRTLWHSDFQRNLFPTTFVEHQKKVIVGALPLKSPLNDLQLEILKLFSRDLDEKDLLAIKRLIVRYLAEKVTRMADQVWEEKGWTEDDMERLLEDHQRTPYDPKN